MRHGIVTIVTRIDAKRRDAEAMRDRLKGLDPDSFKPLIGLHFASLSIIDNLTDRPGDPAFEPHLVFEASFDGTREDFIDDLVAIAGATLDDVYRDCVDYPEPGTRLPQLVKNYLLRHDVGADALYIAYPGRTVGQITQESRLRDALVEMNRNDRTALADRQLPPPMQRSLLSLLRRQVSSNPELQGALTLAERPFVVTYGAQLAEAAFKTVVALLFLGLVVWAYDLPVFGPTREKVLAGLLVALSFVSRLIGVWRPKWRKTALILLVAAAAVSLAGSEVLDAAGRGLAAISTGIFYVVSGLLLVVAAWIVIVQIHEWLDPEPPPPSWNSAREQQLRQMEHRRAQNHMVGLNRIKPGFRFLPFRLWTVRLVLWIIHVTKHLEKSGTLSGISTIHFARWVVIDRGRQVLFLSHYDGDWDAYLGDFVEQASSGLTAIWSNCVGFPRSWLLMFGGARDQRAFKAYARGHQHETLFLHSAYPHLTVADIDNHTAIREALGRSLDTVELDTLLRRL
jgi:hypothetical protein